MGLYPDDEFYIREFEKISGIVLPESVYFLYKDASYPYHGYGSCFVFEVSEGVVLSEINDMLYESSYDSYWCHESGKFEIIKVGKIKLTSDHETGFWGLTKEGYIIASYGINT